ncbi:MAG: ribokinase [Anaerolineae bacterium]|nr:ribokinase [Anaerolineae bacterium]
MGRVLVVGSLHLDVLVNAPDRPRRGETLAGTAWGLQAGGKGGNQAVQAARQGASTTMVGRVGRDDFGEQLLAALRRNGVDTAHVPVDDTAGSGMSVAIIDEQGDYGAVIVSGVNRHITPADVPAELLQHAECVVLQYEIPLATVWSIAQAAHAAGKIVILNAAPAYPTPPAALAAVSLLVVNEIEAAMLAGQPVTTLPEAEAAAAALLAHCPAVIITLGAQGALVAQRGQPMQPVPAFPVTLVDTHGAGDAFIGGLAAQLAAGVPLLPAVRYASATAALTCMGRGPQPDHVTAAAVQQFLADHG